MSKRALVFGLGLLGGGVATANWLLKHGYTVTITDLKDEKQLAPSLKKIQSKVKLALGGHTEQLITEHDLIVVNPDVSIHNPYIQLAQKLGKIVANEATIFYAHWSKKTVAVTGTRGKTTSVNWINHFLKGVGRSVVTGNSYAQPLLSVADQQDQFDWAVTELPSFLLELFDQVERGPGIAVITNLSQDHLNRHGTLEEYAGAKSHIFKKQTPGQHLILNADNQWTDFFIKQKPSAQIRFFSAKPLPTIQPGLFYDRKRIFWQGENGVELALNAEGFVEKMGRHNLENLLASALACRLAGVSWAVMQERINTLPLVEFRQETVFADKNLTIINDTTATSPEGGIAAIERFGGENCLLITGGTDRQLDFSRWAKVVKKHLFLKNLIFIKGSATEKMEKLLNPSLTKDQFCDTLQECLERALHRAKTLPSAVILFSPAAKSFEKFKNEYDRGEQFNDLVRRLTP